MLMALTDNPLLEDILSFVAKNEQNDPAQLILSNKIPDNFPARDVAEQISSRKKAYSKLPELYATGGIVFPPPLSMEQCSSEASAKFKASLLKGKSLVDLTGGFGIDTYYLSSQFEEVHYVEKNNSLCKIAEHNFSIVKKLKHIEIHAQLAEDYLKSLEFMDCVYLDPARRKEGDQKVYRWKDCTPDLIQLKDSIINKSEQQLVKAAPMMDISQGCLELDNQVKKVYVVEWKGEVKELLFFLSKEKCTDPSVEAVMLNDKGEVENSFLGSSQAEKEANIIYSEPSSYLYEPSASVMKTGFFRSLSTQYNLHGLHPNTHLFSSEEKINNFPGKLYKILAIEQVQKKSIQKHLKNKKANLKCRNFPLSVEDLKKKLNIKDGGDNYVFALSLLGDLKRLIVCEKV